MHAFQTLPEGYKCTETINLQKDKKMAVIVNGLGVLIMLVMGIIGHMIIPFFSMLVDTEIYMYFVKLAIMFLLFMIYMAAHEATHAVVMKAFGGGKVRFGFTGLYAYAGSERDYFDKLAYICIALAPMIVWGIVLTIVLCFVPYDWFWVVYFVQIGNFGGSSGDLFVSVKTAGKPSNVLGQDTGIEMSYYETDIVS